jgi:superfamily I DNA and/or RNA helicase
VKSNEAANGGLGVTLFERVIRDPRFAPVVHLLDTQYRMNRLICEWASKAMYEGALVSHPSVAEHTVADLHAVGQTTTAAAIAASNIGSSSVGTMTETVGEEDEEIELYDDDGLPVHVDRKKNVKTAADVDGDDDRVVEPVMLLLDTSGAEMSEESANEGSYRNSGEAHVVMKHVLSLLDDRGLNPREIGVITPYNGQLEVRTYTRTPCT